jgi:hypothetical protein
MDFPNASVAVGIIGSVVTIASMIVMVFKGSKDFRLPVTLTVVTLLAVGLTYISLPPSGAEITRLREEIENLRTQNTQIMQLILNFAGGMPTKAQVEQLVAMVADYKQQIEDLRARIARLSPTEAAKLRSQLAEMERTLERVDAARAEYIALYENQVSLPGKLMGKWVLTSPLDASKVGIVDGLEFLPNGRVRFLEHGKPATWYGTSSRYSLPRPSVLRLHGNGTSYPQDYVFDISGDGIGFQVFGGKGQFRAIRVSPGPSDYQIGLTDAALAGQWRGTPEDWAEREGTRVLTVSFGNHKATFRAFYPTWNQDVYDFDKMQPETSESDYRIPDQRHIAFSAFAGEKSSTSWRAQVYGRLLLLQSEKDSSQRSFMRY